LRARWPPGAPREPSRAATPLRAGALARATRGGPALRSGGSAPRTPAPAPRWVPCPCLPRRAGSSLHLDARSVGPEPFQIVMCPLLGVEHVHHHVAEVEQDPAAPALPLAADHPVPVRRQLFFHAVGDGLELPIARAAPDHQEVRV